MFQAVLPEGSLFLLLMLREGIKIHRRHTARSSPCNPSALRTARPAESAVYDISAPEEHFSALQHAQPFPLTDLHQTVRLPGRRSLHTCLNRTGRFRTW